MLPEWVPDDEFLFLQCKKCGEVFGDKFKAFFSREKLGQKSCRTKVSRIFRFFVPDFAPNFAPNFPRIFRGFFVLHFCGRRRPEKFHPKSPPFFNAKFPGKFEEKIHKMFLESGQSKSDRKLATKNPPFHSQNFIRG